MAERKNFLLGYGERLTAKIPAPRSGGPKSHPYTFEQARERLQPKLDHLVQEMGKLPDEACPNEQVVAVLTLHPSYMAKSYFPDELLSAVGLRHVGSRRRTVRPEKWGKKRHKENALTTELFVSGPRRYFADWASYLSSWSEQTRGADELIELEDVYLMAPEDRVKPVAGTNELPLFEIVLHASALPESQFIISGFANYLHKLGIKADMDRRIHVGGLCFIPVRTSEAKLNLLAKFSFLRVAREMPRLRVVENSMGVSTDSHNAPLLGLSDSSVLDPNVRVAIFDGGLPPGSVLSTWVTGKEPRGIGKAVPHYLQHGQHVTSALLFGHLGDGKSITKPPCRVDHWRVLDEQSGANDPHMQLFDVIQRIHNVLSTNKYDFINLSLGPDMAIEDDDVHVWTAVLDSYLATGETLATIAVGNNGEGDPASGLARIQPPSDCVNAMGVGACDSVTGKWGRAPYSAMGPGRNPGVIKPDAVCFGGVDDKPFIVLNESGMLEGTTGTSFSSPAALRLGVSMRAVLGTPISPLAAKALLVHHCERVKHPHKEAGWGRIPESIEDLITCDDNTAHIIYQGYLEPSKYLRASIPVPSGALAGRLSLKATFCFASETDAQDPVNYTRSGLEVTFRPHDTAKTDPNQQNPDAAPFFKSDIYKHADELELRDDVAKWETTLHKSISIDGDKLKNPMFDIHYNAREGGGIATAPNPIPYALVVTVHAPDIPDLYDRIVRRYRTQLEMLQPVIQIPIQVRR